MDYCNAADLQDPWIILYGHNAGRSGVMFSDLKRFCEEDFCRENDTAILWTEERTEELELLLVSVIDGYLEEVFDLKPLLAGESIDVSAALSVLREGALFPAKDFSAEGTRFVLLSTCYEDGHPEDLRRLVLLYRVKEG